jgi:hypothetical protein
MVPAGVLAEAWLFTRLPSCLWKKLWIISREIRQKVFLPHSRWITFSLLTAIFVW